LIVADLEGRTVLAIATSDLPGLARTAQAPALSPDGSRVVIVLTSDGGSRLFVIDVETRALSGIDTGPASLGEPVWSPDGRWIAARRSEGGEAAITVIAADGSEVRDLVRRPDESERIFQGFSWSPASDRIAYQYLEQGGDVAVVGLDGLITTIAAEPVSEFNPAFSPDGTTLAFLADDGQAVDLASVDGTGRRPFARDVFAGSGCRIWWSPDGAWILGSPVGADCGPTESGALVAVNVGDPTIQRMFELGGRVVGLPAWQRLAP
jgi:Tol biopolymer transport system component